MDPRLAEVIAGSIHFHFFRAGRLHVRLTADWHVHPYALIGQVRGGVVDLEVEGRPRRRLADGCGYVLKPDTAFRITMPRPRPLTYTWTHVNFTVFDTVDIFALIDVPDILPRAAGRLISEINWTQARLHRGPDPAWLRRAVDEKVLGLRLLSVILRHSSLKPPGLVRLDQVRRVLPVLNHVKANLSRPITREELASLVHLSPTRFHYVFKRALGRAPLAYVQMLRVQRAQQLLISGQAPIAEVGRATGHPDPFHFSRQFKKHCGLSPAQYRRQHRDWAGQA